MKLIMKLTPFLFSPFHRVAGALSLGLGLGAIGLAGLIGAGQGLHFDGVLDVHVGFRAPWWVFVAEGLIDPKLRSWRHLIGLSIGRSMLPAPRAAS
jgi:hypothetical protein